MRDATAPPRDPPRDRAEPHARGADVRAQARDDDVVAFAHAAQLVAVHLVGRFLLRRDRRRARSRRRRRVKSLDVGEREVARLGRDAAAPRVANLFGHRALARGIVFHERQGRLPHVLPVGEPATGRDQPMVIVVLVGVCARAADQPRQLSVASVHELGAFLDGRAPAVAANRVYASTGAPARLEHEHVRAALTQPRRRRQPGDARTDDDDVEHAGDHRRAGGARN